MSPTTATSTATPPTATPSTVTPSTTTPSTATPSTAPPLSPPTPVSPAPQGVPPVPTPPSSSVPPSHAPHLTPPPPSSIDDHIAQQVEWYLSRNNLPTDDFLKSHMDADYWVSLDLILTFPRMVRLGVKDKSRVANLLHARSPDIEVDHATARIRPAWALRSNLVLRDVHSSATEADMATVLRIPYGGADSLAAPPVDHLPGLVSLLQVADTVWVAIFESRDAASEALPHVNGQLVRGRALSAEVYFEGLEPHTSPYSTAVYQALPNPYGAIPAVPADASTNGAAYSHRFGGQGYAYGYPPAVMGYPPSGGDALPGYSAPRTSRDGNQDGNQDGNGSPTGRGTVSASASPSRSRVRSFNDVRNVASSGSLRVNGHRAPEGRGVAARTDPRSRSPTGSAPPGQGQMQGQQVVNRKPRRNAPKRGVQRAQQQQQQQPGSAAPKATSQVGAVKAPDVSAMNFPPLSSVGTVKNGWRSGPPSPSVDAANAVQNSDTEAAAASVTSVPVQVGGNSDRAEMDGEAEITSAEVEVAECRESSSETNSKTTEGSGEVKTIETPVIDGASALESTKPKSDGEKEESDGGGGPGATTTTPQTATTSVVMAPKSYAAILRSKPVPAASGPVSKTTATGGSAGSASSAKSNGAQSDTSSTRNSANGSGAFDSATGASGTNGGVSNAKSVAVANGGDGTGSGNEGQRHGNGKASAVARVAKRPPKSPSVWACKPASVVNATAVAGVGAKGGHSAVATARTGRGVVVSGGVPAVNGGMAGRASRLRQGGATSTPAGAPATAARAVVG